MKMIGNDQKQGFFSHSASRQILWFFSSVIFFGIVAVILNVLNLQNLSTCLMGIGASFIVGASVGFLFSIPRIVQRNGNNPGNANNGDDASQYQQHVNTNLTEISDWLTKIIVGLGLVNLGKLGPYLHTIAETLARGIKPADTNSVLALSYGIIVCFSVLGFLFGYIVTRLFLASAFSRADQQALSKLQTTLESTQAQISSIETNQSLINQSLYSSKKETTAQGNEIIKSPDPEMKGYAIEKLEELAIQYLKIDHPDYSERVRLKDNAANEIANFALQNKINKNEILSAAERTGNEGLILALAMVISVQPEAEDFDRLMKIADRVTRLHIRYRVCVALNKLFQSGFARRVADKKRASDLLNNIYRSNADASLQKAIDATLSLINISQVPVA